VDNVGASAEEKRFMSDASSYWSPVCKLRARLRCWVRVGLRAHGSTRGGRWGQLLTMPVEGYLEGPDGPVLLRDVEWVEVSAQRVRGGIAGRPRQMLDIQDDLLSALRGMTVTWELRHSVQVVRVLNPFGPTPARPS
jgi:hypothetical protein